MPHEDDVQYATEVLQDADLDGWLKEQNDEGEWTVWGPCPTCRGAAFGPINFLPPDGPMNFRPPDDGLLKTKASGVLASCACGFSHGKDRYPGCGRMWAVPV